MRISDWSSDVCSSDLDDIDSGVVAQLCVKRPQGGCVGIGLCGIGDLSVPQNVVDHDNAARPEQGEAALVIAVIAFLVGIDEGEVERTGFPRSEEQTSELQSLMRLSYAVFCLKNTNTKKK